jgi:hypothetical protein
VPLFNVVPVLPATVAVRLCQCSASGKRLQYGIAVQPRAPAMETRAPFRTRSSGPAYARYWEKARCMSPAPRVSVANCGAGCCLLSDGRRMHMDPGV